MNKKTLKLWFCAALFALQAVSVSAVKIAVIDAGGSTIDGMLINRSTAGESLAGMTGSFTADAGDYVSDVSTGVRWNNNEYDFGPGSEKTATWTFGGLAQGSEWNVLVSWGSIAQANLSTEAPYTYNGITNLVNQAVGTSSDLTLVDSVPANVAFQKIGIATIAADGNLIVTLSGAADNWVIADAVAIVPASGPAAPEWNSNPVVGDDATLGLTYESTLVGKATDPNFDPITYSKKSGPTWLYVSPDGAISGTAPSTPGTNTFTVTASDGTLSSDTTLEIYIKGTTPPTWIEDPVIGDIAVVGTAYDSTLAGKAIDSEGGEITYSKISGPAWLFVSGDGSLAGTPGASGTNEWVVAATDPDGSTSATLQIVIKEPQPPEWTEDPVIVSSAMIGESYTSTLAGKATEPDGDVIAYAKVSGPAWLYVSADGTLTGIPTAPMGTNSWIVSATDPDGSVNATLNIFVADEPIPTVIAVIDGGGPDAADSSHANIVDTSIGGASIGTMTGSFASDAPGWNTAFDNYWNDTEWDFAPGEGSTAIFTFGNLPIGSEWTVYSTWKDQDNRSQVAPYTIQGGTPILVNQEPVPSADLVLDDGTAASSSYNFQQIGMGIVNDDGELIVTLGSAADDWVIIDAVAIARQEGGSEPVPVIDLVITGPVTGGMVLSWTSVDGNLYGVETNANLVVGNWELLESGILGNGGTLSVTNPVGLEQLFYRVISE